MKTNISKKNIINCAISVVAVALVAWLGGLFVSLGMSWYEALVKPSQYVPNVVFSIVWSNIYIATIVILCLWTKKYVLPKNVLAGLIVNGFFNVLWCLAFFTLHQTLIGLIIIILNLVSSAFLWKAINISKPIYSYVLAIYPVWICLAMCLNLSLWILN